MTERVAPFWDAVVAGGERLSTGVQAVRLQVRSAQPLRYSAGQYVRLHRSDGRRRDLSMATACADDNRLELWVRYAGGPFTEYVFHSMAVGDRWRIEGPLGSAGLRDETAPLWLIAGGTGLGPARAIAQALRRYQPEREAYLIAGARDHGELLGHRGFLEWAAERGHRCYRPVLAEPEASWAGWVGTPDEVLAHLEPDLRGCVAHVFGPPPMVEAVAIAARACGLAGQRLRADAFTPGGLDLDRA